MLVLQAMVDLPSGYTLISSHQLSLLLCMLQFSAEEHIFSQASYSKGNSFTIIKKNYLWLKFYSNPVSKNLMSWSLITASAFECNLHQAFMYNIKSNFRYFKYVKHCAFFIVIFLSLGISGEASIHGNLRFRVFQIEIWHNVWCWKYWQ